MEFVKYQIVWNLQTDLTENEYFGVQVQERVINWVTPHFICLMEKSPKMFPTQQYYTLSIVAW
jgi:hypothetical protein